MALCPRTGASFCHCKEKLARTSKGAALLVDLKCALRRVFGEHTMYTSNLIVASLPTKNEGYAAAVATRLLQNPADIAKLLHPVLETEYADNIEAAFTEHLKLAAACLDPVRDHNKKQTEAAVKALLEQGNDVADLLSALNPRNIPDTVAREEFRQHNMFVVELANLREKEEYEEYVVVLDAYRAHMDGLSDLIYAALIT